MSKLAKWMQLSKLLKDTKEAELLLRKEICSEILKGRLGEIREKAIYDGHNIVVESKVNRSIDSAVLNAIWDSLTEEDTNCIEFKPSLKLANYRKLLRDSLLHEAITEKPSETPTLEVKD